MATRDLTMRFLRQRSSAASRPRNATADGLLGSGAAGAGGQWNTGAIAGMQPQYVDLMDEINSDVNTIKGKIDQLTSLHNARLKVQFDEAQEVEKDREIDLVTADITRLFRSASSKLKRMASGPDRGGTADNRVRKNIQRSIASRLHELSGSFRKAQKQYLGELQRLKEGGSVDMFGGGGGSAGAKDVDMGFSAEQIHAMAEMEESTEWRDQEIARIARSVEELAVLFKDLATLVVEQGTMLDRIDYNMESTVERTKKGVEKLEQAEKYQKSARPLKCMAFLMVLIIILVIILITQHTGDSKK